MAENYLTLEPVPQYFTDEASDMLRYKQLLEQLSLNRIEKELRLAKTPEGEVQKYAELILKGMECIPLSSDDEDTDDHLKNANDVGQILKTVIHRRFLLLIIPSEMNRFRLKVMDDHAAWNFILKTYMEQHKGAKENEALNQSEIKTVFTRTEMFEEIKRFIENDAQSCYEANILFGGHGNTSGISLYKDREEIRIDEITDYVREALKENDIIAQNKIPLAMRLIFSQCHGHVTHTDGGGDQNKVKAKTLASETVPEPRMMVDRIKDSRGNTVEVLNAYIIELNELAVEEPLVPSVVQQPGPQRMELDAPSTPMETESVEALDI